MRRVELELEYPRGFARFYGLNSLYSGKHWAIRKRDADFWHEVVQLHLRKKKVAHKPFEGPVAIFFYWDDRLDLSNEAYAAKMIEDALKGWVIVDDNKKYVKEIHHLTHDKGTIRVVVKELKDGKE